MESVGISSSSTPGSGTANANNSYSVQLPSGVNVRTARSSLDSTESKSEPRNDNKNDKNDARAIVIAALQDDMPTVPVKTIEQQEIQMLHRYRESLVHYRTALGNRIRGYLRESGLFLIVGLSQVRKQVPLLLEDAENELTSGNPPEK